MNRGQEEPVATVPSQGAQDAAVPSQAVHGLAEQEQEQEQGQGHADHGPAADPAAPSAAGPRPVLLAIDGRSGAGKTTLAATLANQLRSRGHSVTVFHLEDVYTGWHGLTGGIGVYVRDVLTPLRAGRTARWHAWDWTRDAPEEEERSTRPNDVVLCEGVGAGAAEARPLLDATLTLVADAVSRKRRALARDGETYAPFWDVWAAQEELLPAPAEGPLDATLDAEDAATHALDWALAALAATTPIA